MDTNCRAKAAFRRPKPALLRTLALTLAFTLTLGLSAWAQQNPLNRKIKLELRQVRLDDALFAIGRAADFDFSYNSQQVPTDSLVNVQARDESVRKVLNALLGSRFQTRPLGNHLVIALRVQPPAIEELPVHYAVEGYLINAESGEKVRYATVFASPKEVANTDEEGHYRIELESSMREVALSFSKRGYHDTVVVLRADRSPSLTVGLRPYPNLDVPMASREVSVIGDRAPEPLPFVDWFVSQEQQALAANLPGPIRTFPIQVSFLPAFGTNRILSGGMANNFSLNILAGYSNGLRGLEIGGLANIDRENVAGCQIGGLVNVVGGNVSGLQIGGLVNHVRGNVSGLQIGGLVNVDHADVKGLQIAGLVNITPRPVQGAQISGLVSMAKGDVTHIQIGGLANYAKGNVGGFQIGGISSYAQGNVGGFQIGGITSFAKGDVGGFQIGGIANYAQGDVKGFQIGGILNRARNIRGFQIGLINIADSSGGFQLGLVNVVKKGYTAIEFSTNEVFQVNLAYKAGRRGFYNFLAGGYRFGPRTQALAYGAGLGSSSMLGPVSIGGEVSCYQVAESNFGFGQLNLLMPLRVSAGINLGRLEFYGGPSATLHVTGAQDNSGAFRSQIGSRPFWREDGPSTRVQAWAGWQAGLRIALVQPEARDDDDKPRKVKEAPGTAE